MDLNLLLNKYWWRRKHREVREIFFPKNRWVNEVVPRHFADVDYIFEDVLFAGLVHFWEKDRGEETLRYQWECDPDEFMMSSDHQAHCREVYDIAKAAYDWAKVRKQKHDDVRLDWKEEQDLIAEDTKHLQNIIKYRKYLWS